MLQSKAAVANLEGRMRRVLFLNSFFFTRLIETDKQYNYANVRTWIKHEVGGKQHKEPAFLFHADLAIALDKIFFPVNIRNYHWALLVLNLSAQEVSTFLRDFLFVCLFV